MQILFVACVLAPASILTLRQQKPKPVWFGLFCLIGLVGFERVGIGNIKAVTISFVADKR